MCLIFLNCIIIILKNLHTNEHIAIVPVGRQFLKAIYCIKLLIKIITYIFDFLGPSDLLHIAQSDIDQSFYT